MITRCLLRIKFLTEKRIKEQLKKQSAKILYSLNTVGEKQSKYDENYYANKLSIVNGMFVYVDQVCMINVLFFKVEKSVRERKKNRECAMRLLFFKRILSKMKKNFPWCKKIWQKIEIKNNQTVRKIVLQGKSKKKTLKKNIISLKENSEQLKKMWLNIQGAMQALKKYESEGKSTLNLNWTEGLNECWLKQLIKKSVKNLKIDLKKTESYQDEILQEVCKANSIHWPFESIKVLIEQRLSEGQNYSNGKNESNQIGSKLFTQMWRSYAVNKRKENAQNKLTLLMSVVEMETLDGSRKQAQKLLRSFGEITPDSFFWNDLAKTVQIAFPKGLAVSSNQVLAQKIHQFRYVISLQQMEFIREHYSRLNMNDEAALACYLSGLRREQYSLKESARLHQKRKSKNGQGPRGYLKTNIKVVVNFHSEFILSDNGSFVNEIETKKESKENENGVVNGASFNYADANDYRGKNGAKWNSKRSKHYILDINIPKKMEPEFRTEFTRRYKAPSLIRYKLKNDPIYAAANQSAYQINQLAVREFEKKLS